MSAMFTISEIATMLKVSPACAYSLVETGQLPCFRIGKGRGTIRVSDEQLQQYLRRAARLKPTTESYIK